VAAIATVEIIGCFDKKRKGAKKSAWNGRVENGDEARKTAAKKKKKKKKKRQRAKRWAIVEASRSGVGGRALAI
jgi:hypothetical protein